jgi:hypothetical protein
MLPKDVRITNYRSKRMSRPGRDLQTGGGHRRWVLVWSDGVSLPGDRFSDSMERPSNRALERPAGSHSLAAVAHRRRYAD